MPPGTTRQGAPAAVAARDAGAVEQVDGAEGGAITSRPGWDRRGSSVMPGKRKASRMAALTQASTRQPPGAAGSGPAARTLAELQSVEDLGHEGLGGRHELVVGASPAAAAQAARHAPPRAPAVPCAGDGVVERRRHAATACVGLARRGPGPPRTARSAAALGLSERQQRLAQDVLDEAHLRQRRLDRHRVGAHEVDAHEVAGSARGAAGPWPSRPRRAAAHRRAMTVGHLVGGHRDDAVAAEGQQRAASSCHRPRGPRSPPVGRAGWS